MKNLIVSSSVAAITVLMLTSFALANGLPTGSYVPPGVGDAPIVKAKWETVPSAPGSDLDDDTDKPWTQVNPPLSYGATKTIKYWMVVTDPNGFGDLTDKAYVEVFHPNGSLKYQIEMNEFYDECPEDEAKIQQAIDALTDAYNQGLVTFNTGYCLNEVVAELEQCSAKLFTGEAEIHFHQPCGEFDWTYQCVGTPPDCDWEWTATCKTSGYKVAAYAFDKYNVKSDDLVNFFEYICVPMFELDFERL